MKNVFSVALLVSGLVLFFPSRAAGMNKETYLYSVKGADSLYLDRYDSGTTGKLASPCVVFMFGGGFFTGERDREYYMPYFEYLVNHGYTVVSIDYRLGLKRIASGEATTEPPRKMGKIKQAKALLGVFRSAIDLAVEDLFDATSYILNNSNAWGIDPARIIANGSSAGAISVLHGEYAICNGEEVAHKLPEDFNYAGVVSFAGAIFMDARDINFRSMPCPVMLFHGDADSNVPYNKIKKLGMGFFGSKYISKKLTRMGAPHIFYSVENADHSIAGSPMNDNREDILSFLTKMVDKGERLIIDADVDQLNVPAKKKRFKIADYIKSNFSGGE